MKIVALLAVALCCFHSRCMNAQSSTVDPSSVSMPMYMSTSMTPAQTTLPDTASNETEPDTGVDTTTAASNETEPVTGVDTTIAASNETEPDTDVDTTIAASNETEPDTGEQTGLSTGGIVGIVVGVVAFVVLVTLLVTIVVILSVKSMKAKKAVTQISPSSKPTTKNSTPDAKLTSHGKSQPMKELPMVDSS